MAGLGSGGIPLLWALFCFLRELCLGIPQADVWGRCESPVKEQLQVWPPSIPNFVFFVRVNKFLSVSSEPEAL